MKIYETLVYLIAIRILISPDVSVSEASIPELLATKNVLNKILESLPVTGWWQFGRRYVLAKIRKELDAVNVILEIASGLAHAFGGHVQDTRIVYGTLSG